MGISANQARLLSLTARKCDLETEMQIILNKKLSIARETADIANDYNNAISNRKLFIFKPTANENQTIYNEVNASNLYNNGGLLVVRKVNKDVNNPSGYQQIGGESSEQIEKGLREGTLFLVRQADIGTQDPKTITFTTGYGKSETSDPTILSTAPTNKTWEIVSWRDSTTIMDQLDKSDDEEAKMNYETAMNQISIKENEMNLEMNEIETAHSAISNEMESVKKIMDKNTEDSFKYFS